MKKKRTVDFSVEEMCEMSGLERKQFTDVLKRFCTLYDFDITDFKADETNSKSNYFFPPEIAAPLALLLKHLQTHPMYRKNAKEGNITATDYAEYNSRMLKDIDEELPKYFKEAIYSLMGHLVNYEISEWAKPFVRELSHFMVNLTTLKNESAGAALRDFTKKLSVMNYNLFEGTYYIRMAEDANVDYAINEMGFDEPNELDKTLQAQNISLDKLIAAIIRWELIGAHHMRDEGFPELEDILNEENAWRRLMGEKRKITRSDGKVLFEDILDPDEDDQREAYYAYVLGDTINKARANMNKAAYETMKKNREKWKPIDEIVDTDEELNTDGGSDKDDIKKLYQSYLERGIESVSSKLDELKQEKEEYDRSGMVPKSFHSKIDSDKEILSAYSEYCKDLDKSKTRIYDIVDHFVGEALFEFLNNTN